MKKVIFLQFLFATTFFVAMLIGCKSSKHIATSAKYRQVAEENTSDIVQLRKITDNACNAGNIVANIKFSTQGVTLSGSLKMRRNDCIQIQLVALGFMEAARIELTPEYVMAIDRLHKRFTKVAYEDLDFLSATGASFFTLQAMFWNELFCPNVKELRESDLRKFAIQTIQDNDIILLKDEAKPRNKLMSSVTVSWNTNHKNGQINKAVISYIDDHNRTSELLWQYDNFASLLGASYPMKDNISIRTPKMNVEAEVTLSSVSTDGNWGSRTNVSDRYEQVSFGDLIKGLTSL